MSAAFALQLKASTIEELTGLPRTCPAMTSADPRTESHADLAAHAPNVQTAAFAGFMLKVKQQDPRRLMRQPQEPKSLHSLVSSTTNTDNTSRWSTACDGWSLQVDQ